MGRKLTKIRLVSRGGFDRNTEEIINKGLESLCRDGCYIRDVKFCMTNVQSGFMIIYDTEEDNG